ncbi:hypothetical protein BN77_4152 [Rhizobium mesoamericanum STM3625]|uniref:Uncharacterized protein n=1 Tax=Rhizobium mesoamericanum STM3625 TaxID=1211777 RepID=K0Q383_9HYPH|nr:hypothetical protein BN77_4152 [Rhizobium mesoamericanum STM3625]
MMTNRITHIGDEEAAALVAGGKLAPSSRRPDVGTREPVILIHRSVSPPPVASIDAMEPDLGFEQLGSIAVRLMATWKLPRMSLEPARERRDGPQLPSPYREEED